jgi:hypothetical protein
MIVGTALKLAPARSGGSDGLRKNREDRKRSFFSYRRGAEGAEESVESQQEGLCELCASAV